MPPRPAPQTQFQSCLTQYQVHPGQAGGMGGRIDPFSRTVECTVECSLQFYAPSAAVYLKAYRTHGYSHSIHGIAPCHWLQGSWYPKGCCGCKGWEKMGKFTYGLFASFVFSGNISTTYTLSFPEVDLCQQ